MRRKKETQSCCYLQGHARQWRSRDIGGGGGRRDGGGGGLNMHNTLCCCGHRHFFSSSSSPFQDDDRKTPKEKEKKPPLFSLSGKDLSHQGPTLLSPRPHPSPNTPSNNRRRTHSAAEMQHKRSEECLCRLPLRQKVSGREKLQRFLKNPFLEITSQADDPGKNSAGEKKTPPYSCNLSDNNLVCLREAVELWRSRCFSCVWHFFDHLSMIILCLTLLITWAWSCCVWNLLITWAWSATLLASLFSQMFCQENCEHKMTSWKKEFKTSGTQTWDIVRARTHLQKLSKKGRKKGWLAGLRDGSQSSTKSITWVISLKIKNQGSTITTPELHHHQHNI